MCSVVDGAFIEEEESFSNILEEKPCQKCKIEKPILTLRRKDVYCKMCFLTNCNHKFRSTLGKNKAIRPNDRILVTFSGGQGSLAVLKLIRNSLEDENNPKKVSYIPHIFIIDELGIDNSFELSEVLKLAKTFDFPIYVAHLSMVMNCKDETFQNVISESGDYVVGSDQTDNGKEFLSLLSQTLDQSAKLSLIKDMKRQLMLRAASDLNCSKIFTGECATSLAITLLSGVATGRGAQVGNEAGFCDRRSSEVQILRPLREFSIKEVSYFIQHNWDYSNLDKPNEASNEENDDKFSSIEELTKSFVIGLQEGFPSTVPTIFRTGDKLLLESNSALNCIICEGIIDTGKNEDQHCTALEATEFSKLVSLRGPKGLANDQLTFEKFNRLSIQDKEFKPQEEAKSDCSGEGLCAEGGSCKSKGPGFESEMDWKNVLCYNCSPGHLFKDPQKLPKFLKDSAAKNLRHNQMKNEIQDFLL